MDFKLVGSPCGEHGPYTFYKAFRYTKNGRTDVLSLSEFFFVKLWADSDLISIGELQLLWEDRNSEQTLASLRLYILPENTPEGRCDVHGEDEVLAITEKVVLRVEDLLTWITQASDWNWGMGAVWEKDCPEVANPAGLPTTGLNRIAIDMEDVNKEKQLLDEKHWETTTGVVVLSYPRYCRYRGILKRLEGVHNKWLRTGLVVALGGFTAPCKNTRVLFCKDTFDYPELEGHELLCNHLAPKLKGRPRRKRKKLSVSPENSESESESSQSTSSSTSKVQKATTSSAGAPKPRLRCTLEVKRATRGPSAEEKNFLSSLHGFMNERKTPIGRIPIVGFKEVNLFKLFRKVIDLGGYDAVSSGKMWKHVYEALGGDTSVSSAATLSRRHYEKLLLPYERHLNGKAQPSKVSKTLPTATDAVPEPKPETKPSAAKSSSLRSIRLKQEKVVAVGEKENIPQKGAPPPQQPVVKKEPEIIDLVSDESPVKLFPPPLTPMVKKQKLEILKEGGLEVTPIGGGARASVIKHGTSGPPPHQQNNHGLVQPQLVHPNGSTGSNGARLHPPIVANTNKVSITVTPDMSHLMYPPGPSKKPVYGNPKEQLAGTKKSGGPLEVLDLRTKPRGHQQQQNVTGLVAPQLNIGSNLEITLVPPSKPKAPTFHPPKRRPPPPPPQAHHRSLPLAPPPPPPPPSSLRTHPKHQPHSRYRQQPSAPAYPAQRLKAPPPSYIPVMDPIYLSALYNGIFSPPVYPGSPHVGRAPPQGSIPAQDTLSVYKELMRRQGMFPLLQDGSTSITLVTQSTPTSK